MASDEAALSGGPISTARSRAMPPFVSTRRLRSACRLHPSQIRHCQDLSKGRSPSGLQEALAVQRRFGQLRSRARKRRSLTPGRCRSKLSLSAENAPTHICDWCSWCFPDQRIISKVSSNLSAEAKATARADRHRKPWRRASPGHHKRHNKLSSHMPIRGDDNRIPGFRPLPDPVKVWLQLPFSVLICTQCIMRAKTCVLNNIYGSSRN
jgi:hypothetical protein